MIYPINNIEGLLKTTASSNSIRLPQQEISQKAQPKEKNENLLKKAKEIASLYGNNDDKTINKIYELISGLSTFLQDLDLKPILTTCANSGITLSPKRLRDYGLISMETSSGKTGSEKTWNNKYTKDQKKRISMYLDAPTAIGLTYKEVPNALISFYLEDPETLFIPQIQGIRPTVCIHDERGLKTEVVGHSRGLMVLNFEKLLILVVEKLAHELGISEVIIQGSTNNTWSKIRGTDRGETRYDNVAINLGYKKHRDKNWHKMIKGKVSPDQDYWYQFFSSIFYASVLNVSKQ